MTIAVCYLSPEGLVLGADSTSTYLVGAAPHYFNHAQKIFEIGEGSTLGIVTWGLGGLAIDSHRRLVAVLADDLEKKPAKDVAEVAARWVDQFWSAYQSALAGPIAQCKTLSGKQPHKIGNPPAPNPHPDARTEQEERDFEHLASLLVAGFCIGGYVPSDRTPAAFEMVFDPLKRKPAPRALAVHQPQGWGAPSMIKRLIMGIDDGLKASILTSGKWSGTPAELDALAQQFVLSHPILPIRDAIDFVHTCVYSTIKAFKFSNLSQICGGPIELAVITVDRKFRWVQHKPWTSAIDGGE